MDLDRAIKLRKSCRKFSRKKPDWRDIIECIDSVRFAPMAGNNFSLKFIVVDDEEKIRKISEASQQTFINQVSYVVVVYSEPSRVTNSFGKMGERYLNQQAGAAIQNFLLKIEQKGLATCWVGHFVEEEIKRNLKIPASGILEAVFPIGYPLEKKKKGKRISLDNILYFNEAKNKKMKSD